MTAVKEVRPAKAEKPAPAPPVSLEPRGMSAAAILGSLLILGGFVAGGVFLWQKFEGEVTAAPEYTLRAQDIEISPQPPWARSDVKAEVLKGGLLEKLDIHEPKLTVLIAQAFELHPWVAQVTRVTKKYPAGIVVEVQYRRPLAMVEVNLNGQPGLLPIDAKGVLLPPDDFSASDARQYLRIAAGNSGPAGSVGSSWGDERILGAANIAALLSDCWQAAGLHRIVVTAVFPGDRQPASYDLVTRGNVRLAWGRAPTHERSGEATAVEKLSRVNKLIDLYGTIESSGLKEIDLRDAATFLPQPPRTAGRAAPSASPTGFDAPRAEN